MQSIEKFNAKKENRREKIEANISIEQAKRISFHFISLRREKVYKRNWRTLWLFSNTEVVSALLDNMAKQTTHSTVPLRMTVFYTCILKVC